MALSLASCAEGKHALCYETPVRAEGGLPKSTLLYSIQYGRRLRRASAVPLAGFGCICSGGWRRAGMDTGMKGAASVQGGQLTGKSESVNAVAYSPNAIWR